jgi:bifunctional N-acetylglucosamine-1-phosphate-uridyltransferase/glucosamine-1-phosphate-acetyltransferase GlmU-like protein
MAIHKIKEDKNSTFILLNAGKGRTLSGSGPKCLNIYRNKRIIDHQISVIKKQFNGNIDIIIAAGYKADSIINTVNERVVENTRYEDYDISESLRVALNASLGGHLYIAHGDIIFSRSCLVIPDTSKSYAVISKTGIKKDGIGITYDKSINRFDFGLPVKWGQIVFLSEKDQKKLKKILNSKDDQIKFKSTYELLNILIDSGSVIYPLIPKNTTLIEINSGKDL